MRLKQFYILFLGLLILVINSGFEPIRDEYLSPEHICIDKGRNTIYIGLSTSSGIAEYDIETAQISRIIPMPGPVSDIAVDEEENILYAGSRETGGELFVYDLNVGKLCKSIKTGYGPSSLSISQKKGLLFVANRFNNDISVIDLKKKKEINRIDAVREPVSLSLSPGGNILAVANLLPSQPSTGEYVSAYVTLIDINSSRVVKNVMLPNGSYSLKDVVFSPDGKYIYVTHLIGRYNVLTNQIEKGWINTNALSVIDPEAKELYTTVLLDDIYKGAANPCGLDISDDGRKLYVAISGTHELFAIDRAGMHNRIERTKEVSYTSQTIEPVSKEENNIQVFEDFNKIEPLQVLFKNIPNELSFLTPVRDRIKLQGKGPAYIVSDGNDVYITSYFSDGLDIVGLNKGVTEQKFVQIGSRDISLSKVRYGEMLFNNADNCFQNWQSCSSCHPGKGRSDGLNWDLMNDGIGNPKNTKSLLYSHETPPAMATGIRKDAETGVRAGFKYIQFYDVPEEDASAVDEYLKSLKPVPSPLLVDGKLSKSALRGKRIFEKRKCSGCHSGPRFTDGKQYEIGTKGKYDKQKRWDTPALVELWRTSPYLHDGRYSSIEDVFRKEKHGIYGDISDDEIRELTEYLLSL